MRKNLCYHNPGITTNRGFFHIQMIHLMGLNWWKPGNTSILFFQSRLQVYLGNDYRHFCLLFNPFMKSLDVCLSIVWLYDDSISHQGSFYVCILFSGFNLISRPKLLSYFLDQRKVQITDSQWFFLTLWLSVDVCSVYLMFWSNTEMKQCRAWINIDYYTTLVTFVKKQLKTCVT